MKRVKFSNGYSALFAFVMVALATIFTACEKEEFNVNVKPANAKAVITPMVYFTAQDGTTSVVTDNAEITGTPGLEFVGNPNLAKSTASITASYTYQDAVTETNNTITGTISNFEIQALQAGQFVAYTPNIILTAPASNLVTETETATEETVVDTENGYIENNTNQYWTTTRTFKARKGAANPVVTYTSGATEKEKAFLDKVAEGLTMVEYTESKEFTVMAMSRTNIKIEHKAKKVTVTYTRKEDTAVGRAASEVVIGTISYDEYSGVNVTAEVNVGLNGHGQGHGHGDGHGTDANAGGGITMAD